MGNFNLLLVGNTQFLLYVIHICCEVKLSQIESESLRFFFFLGNILMKPVHIIKRLPFLSGLHHGAGSRGRQTQRNQSGIAKKAGATNDSSVA